MIHLQTAYVWEKGPGRAKNQDSLSLQQIRVGKQPMTLAAVCDGIGGLAEGETASGSAVEALTDWFYRDFLEMSGREESKYGRGLAFWLSLRKLKKSLSRRLYETAEKLKRYRKEEDLGTTCTAAILWGSRYLIVHVGDSLAYRVKNRRARAITLAETDDSGALVNALGSFALRKPSFRAGKLRRNQGILLASDGFYRYFTRDRLAQSLGVAKRGPVGNQKRRSREELLSRKLMQMAGQAREHGSRDDCTAIYIYRGK